MLLTEDNDGIRLNRYLAQCGLGSRRECDRIIAAGRVYINGKKVTELGTKVCLERDVVEHAGRTMARVRGLEYYAYHKSRGSVVTARDPEGRTTIYDALTDAGLSAAHLRYVGRLDRNSEGLLLLTNDGDLIHALTHPRFHIKKVYRVRVDRPVMREDMERMVKEGIESDGQLLRAGAVRLVEDPGGKDEHWYEVDLYEGKNRQIRRMFEGLNYKVQRLRRIQFGVIKLRGLRRGAYRPLMEREVKGLKNLGYQNRKSDVSRETHAGKTNR